MILFGYQSTSLSSDQAFHSHRALPSSATTPHVPRSKTIYIMGKVSYKAVLAGALLAASGAHASVVINEVAPKGDGVKCGGKDWIELYNGAAAEVNIGDFQIHDDKLAAHPDTFTFAAGTKIASKGFLLLCQKDTPTAATEFKFGIGGEDTVTLLNAAGTVVDTTGKLPKVDFEVTDPSPTVYKTYAREKDGAGAVDGTAFKVLRKPSPGASNKDMLPDKLQVYLNEIADKGTDMAKTVACDPPADYVEIYNAEPDAVNITGWRLHDDNGKDHKDAYVHSGAVIPAGGFMLLCGEYKDGTGGFHDFKFGIGSDDKITLLDAANNTMDTAGPLLKRGDTTTVYGRTEDGSGIWTYLTPPTPKKTNKGMKYKPEGDAAATAPPGSSTVVLNEIADKGSDAVCNGEDWVELYNYGKNPVDIGKWHLADEKGVLHSDVHIFPDNDKHVIPGYGFLLLCGEETFKFGIGGTDTVTLLNDKKQVVDEIELTGLGSPTKTMQRKVDGTGEWAYSENPAPSPGKSNCVGGCPLPAEDDDKKVSGGVIAGAVLGTVAGATVAGVIAHRVVNNYNKEKVPKTDRGFIDVNNV